MVGANLTGADLTDADLSYVDMTGAIMTKDQLSRVKSLEGAILPENANG